jgi:hypothetical protein
MLPLDRRSKLSVIWDRVDDPDARYWVRRAVELILSDFQEQMKRGFDTRRSPGHDEKVLVGNNNETTSTQ